MQPAYWLTADVIVVGIDVGADQVMLLGSSHSRLRFSPSKEARAGIV